MPIKTLTETPFLLRAESMVTARISGKVAEGWSKTSDPNVSGPKIISAPAKMDVP